MIKEAALCDICRKILAVAEQVFHSHIRITIGIHPAAFEEWEPPMPVIECQFDFCQKYGFENKLITVIDFLQRKISRSPYYQEGLGHFVTIYKVSSGGKEKLSAAQFSKQDFIDFLSTFLIFAHGLFPDWNK
jgi:hypothetical protein